MSGKYDDILNLPHPVSAVHPQMPLSGRAAQFSPFAALTGYEEAVQETARLTESRPELAEDRKEALNEILGKLAEQAGNGPEAEITYFIPDERKEGGTFRTVHGKLRKIEEFERCAVMEDGCRIPVDDILDIRIADNPVK